MHTKGKDCKSIVLVIYNFYCQIYIKDLQLHTKFVIAFSLKINTYVILLSFKKGKIEIPNRRKKPTIDVAVIVGGMAGISAAVLAIRNGPKTVLDQNRSVQGGNASSEMRVSVNSALRERETGIVDEILIENRRHYNANFIDLFLKNLYK